MRNFKLGFALLLMMLAFGCANQDMIEETAPAEVTIENQRGSFGGIPIQEPTDDPVEAVISIEYDPGFDRLHFLQTYGPQLGLIKARQCPFNPNMEVWRINYISYEALGALLDSLFLTTYPDHDWTTSNGTGAEPVHPPYRTRTAPPPSSIGPHTMPFNEIVVFYEDFCHEDNGSNDPGNGTSTH